MPLGLELAAANAGGLPLTAIADAIEQSAEFLTVDWRDVPERQRSMRAVFAWSWQLLSAEEQPHPAPKLGVSRWVYLQRSPSSDRRHAPALDAFDG